MILTCCGLYYLSNLMCYHILFTLLAPTMLASHFSSTILITLLSQNLLLCWSLYLKVLFSYISMDHVLTSLRL